MRKIVSNILIVSTQLIVGSLFLFMLFSDSKDDGRVAVVENNNLDKMADAVSELFVVDHAIIVDVDTKKEEELVDAEQKRLEEEARLQAEEEARAAEEAARLAREEEERKKAEEEEERRRAEEEAARQLTVVDASGYVSKPALGFNVTTDNQTYELSDEEFAILATVVSCEANRSSKDDILAVMSVILNRADSSRYPNDPVSVVAAPYQFSCYTGVASTPNELVASVMKDALSGVRNNEYYGFRSWQTTSYSDNYIVERGNRYS